MFENRRAYAVNPLAARVGTVVDSDVVRPEL
jgi:hypothetical protein